MSGDPTTFVTAKEAARQFDVHKATVIRWARAGTLRGNKMPGGQWRFTQAEIDRWLKDAS